MAVPRAILSRLGDISPYWKIGALARASLRVKSVILLSNRTKIISTSVPSEKDHLTTGFCERFPCEDEKGRENLVYYMRSRS